MRAVAAWLVVVAAACGDDDDPACGAPFDAGDGVTVTLEGTTFTYGAFTWNPANDCPASPDEISVTVRGAQKDPAPSAPAGIVFCLPRPSAVGSAPISLADPTLFQLVSVNVDADGCRTSLPFSPAATGTATFAGFCPTDEHTHNVTLQAAVPGTRACTTTVSDVTLTLSGTATVTRD